MQKPRCIAPCQSDGLSRHAPGHVDLIRCTSTNESTGIVHSKVQCTCLSDTSITRFCTGESSLLGRVELCDRQGLGASGVVKDFATELLGGRGAFGLVNPTCSSRYLWWTTYTVSKQNVGKIFARSLRPGRGLHAFISLSSSPVSPPRFLLN